MELLIATNPDPESSLRYLLRLPLAGGLCFAPPELGRAPRRLYCYPVPVEEWPEYSEIIERVPLLSCARRGAAVDLILDRAARIARRSCSPTPGAAKQCSGNHRASASRPARTCAPQRHGRAGSPSWRSSSIPTSSTPTTSPANRSAPHSRTTLRRLRRHRRRTAGRLGRTQISDRARIAARPFTTCPSSNPHCS